MHWVLLLLVLNSFIGASYAGLHMKKPDVPASRQIDWLPARVETVLYITDRVILLVLLIVVLEVMSVKSA